MTVFSCLLSDRLKSARLIRVLQFVEVFICRFSLASSSSSAEFDFVLMNA